MGVRIEVRDGETIGKALRRLKKLVSNAGITWELHRHKYRLKPCEERRRKRGIAKVRACIAARNIRWKLGIEPRKRR
jgi:ribosomal protein S21